MKNFSIFELALGLSGIQPTNNLDRVSSISRREFEERESFVCRTTAASVEYACLMIENALLLRTNRGGRVYGGFERLSALQPIIDRYLRIADVSEAVYVFGENDWRPPRHPNVRVVSLRSEFQLAHESFLIAQSSTFNVAFIASRALVSPTNQEPPSVVVLKTSNVSVVARLTGAAEGVIDWSLAA